MRSKASRRYDTCRHRVPTFDLIGSGWRQGFLATLHCPNKAVDGLTGDSLRLDKAAAAEELKTTVAPLACGSCALHKLTEVQVMERQANLAKAQVALVNAESERIEAIQRHNDLVTAGKGDVDAINANILRPDLTCDIPPAHETPQLPPAESPSA